MLAPARRSTPSTEDRDRFNPTPSTKRSDPGVPAASASQKSADEMSPGIGASIA